MQTDKAQISFIGRDCFRGNEYVGFIKGNPTDGFAAVDITGNEPKPVHENGVVSINQAKATLEHHFNLKF